MKRGNTVPFWALMAFTYILLFAPQASFPALAPYRIALLAAVAGITAQLWDNFVHGQPLTLRTREIWIVACLAGWAVLTVPFSYWPGGSLSFLLELYFKTLAIFWLLCNAVNTRDKFRWVAWGMSLMASGLAVIGIDNYLEGAVMRGDEYPPRILGNEAALTKNPNDLALMLNLILPLSVSFVLGNRQPAMRAVLVVSIALSVTAVILTYSRAGFLTLATTFALYLWKLRHRPERKWAWAAVVVALLCLPLLPSSYWDRMGTITNISADQTGSAQARWRDMIAALEVVLENPVVGFGVGMNLLALNEERGATWTAVHNVYLQYAVELGLPGLVLFLLLLGGCFKNVAWVQRRAARIPSWRELFYLAEGLQISLLAFTVAALFHPVAYHFYFYYVAGLAVAAKALCQRDLEGEW